MGVTIADGLYATIGHFLGELLISLVFLLLALIFVVYSEVRSYKRSKK